jgi:arginase family enzyme
MAYVRTWKRFHLIIDINILDPSFVPGLRSPVPGGLSTRDLLYVVQRLQLIRSLGEIRLIFDSEPEPATCEAVAHLLAELHTV